MSHDFMDLPDDFPDLEEVKVERYNNDLITNITSPEIIHLNTPETKKTRKKPNKEKVEQIRKGKTVIQVSLDDLCFINKELGDYKKLLLKEISRLAEHKFSTDLIMKRCQELVKLEEAFPIINHFISIYKDKNFPEPFTAYSDIMPPIYRGVPTVDLKEPLSIEKNIAIIKAAKVKEDKDDQIPEAH